MTFHISSHHSRGYENFKHIPWLPYSYVKHPWAYVRLGGSLNYFCPISVHLVLHKILHNVASENLCFSLWHSSCVAISLLDGFVAKMLLSASAPGFRIIPIPDCTPAAAVLLTSYLPIPSQLQVVSNPECLPIFVHLTFLLSSRGWDVWEGIYISHNFLRMRTYWPNSSRPGGELRPRPCRERNQSTHWTRRASNRTSLPSPRTGNILLIISAWALNK